MSMVQISAANHFCINFHPFSNSMWVHLVLPIPGCISCLFSCLNSEHVPNSSRSWIERNGEREGSACCQKMFDGTAMPAKLNQEVAQSPSPSGAEPDRPAPGDLLCLCSFCRQMSPVYNAGARSGPG
ncbi:hypothetical protein SEVIR_5G009732v4 [Setaria viridis]